MLLTRGNTLCLQDNRLTFGSSDYVAFQTNAQSGVDEARLLLTPDGDRFGAQFVYGNMVHQR